MSFMETNYWWTHSLIGCATSPCQSHQKQDTHGRAICESHSPHQSKFDTAAAGFAVKVHSIQQSSHSLMRRHSHAAAGPTSIGLARSQLSSSCPHLHTPSPRSCFGSRYISVKTFHYIWWGWSMAMLTTTWEARGLKIYSFEATCRRVPYFPIKPSRPHWPIKRLSSAAALKQSTLTLNVCTVQHWKTPFTIQIFTRQTAGQLHCGFSTRIWR